MCIQILCIYVLIDQVCLDVVTKIKLLLLNLTFSDLTQTHPLVDCSRNKTFNLVT